MNDTRTTTPLAELVDEHLPLVADGADDTLSLAAEVWAGIVGDYHDRRGFGPWSPVPLRARPSVCRSDPDTMAILAAHSAGERVDGEDLKRARAWTEWRFSLARDREETAGRLFTLLHVMNRCRVHRTEAHREAYVELQRHLVRAWRIPADVITFATGNHKLVDLAEEVAVPVSRRAVQVLVYGEYGRLTPWADEWPVRPWEQQ